jgi:hypothetical protein
MTIIIESIELRNLQKYSTKKEKNSQNKFIVLAALLFLCLNATQALVTELFLLEKVSLSFLLGSPLIYISK